MVDEPSEEEVWKQQLHAILTQKLDPAAFERLVQRVLRELEFQCACGSDAISVCSVWPTRA